MMNLEAYPLVLIFIAVITVVKALTGGFSDEEPWEKTLREIKKKETEEKEKGMEEERNMQITNEEVQVEIGTRDLLLGVLTQIGCQYTIDGEERINFAFQGEYLWAEASNDCRFVNVFDTYWDSCEMYDVDRVAQFKRAVNQANLMSAAVIVYTEDDAGELWFHCKRGFLFIPQIPHITDYLRTILGSLFETRRAMYAMMTQQGNNA
jgi:hypothetical protein